MSVHIMIRKPELGNHTLNTQTLDELKQTATAFRQKIAAGDFIALTGALGSGKTTFAQNLCNAMGVSEEVTSPTFTLINEYTTPTLTIIHSDTYRLTENEANDFTIELEDRLSQDKNIVLLEWADTLPILKPLWTWHIHFEHDHTNETKRNITITELKTKTGRTP